MNIDPIHFFTWGGSLVGLAGVWYRSQFKIERLEEKQSDQRSYFDDISKESTRQIEAIWEWKEKHGKESADIREHFNKEIAQVQGSLLVTNEQFKQIMNMLQDIKDRVSKIEASK